MASTPPAHTDNEPRYIKNLLAPVRARRSPFDQNEKDFVLVKREKRNRGQGCLRGKERAGRAHGAHIARTHSESRQAGLPAQGLSRSPSHQARCRLTVAVVSGTLVGTGPPPNTAARPRWNPRSFKQDRVTTLPFSPARVPTTTRRHLSMASMLVKRRSKSSEMRWAPIRTVPPRRDKGTVPTRRGLIRTATVKERSRAAAQFARLEPRLQRSSLRVRFANEIRSVSFSRCASQLPHAIPRGIEKAQNR
jgi:hypothetical protein